MTYIKSIHKGIFSIKYSFREVLHIVRECKKFHLRYVPYATYIYCDYKVYNYGV
jgi:hypothetical protein